MNKKEEPSHGLALLVGELRVRGSLAFERACGCRVACRRLKIAQGCLVPL